MAMLIVYVSIVIRGWSDIQGGVEFPAVKRECLYV